MISAPLLHPDVFQIVIKILYIAALFYGCVSDIKSLKIPNAVPVAVAALFLLHRWSAEPGIALSKHAIVAAVALLLGFCVFAAGLIGAGDVKLISALMLWAGPRDGLAFLIVMSCAGGIFAGLPLLACTSMAVWPSSQHYIPSRRLRTWAERGVFPYGVAICCAGLVLAPAFFAPR